MCHYGYVQRALKWSLDQLFAEGTVKVVTPIQFIPITRFGRQSPGTIVHSWGKFSWWLCSGWKLGNYQAYSSRNWAEIWGGQSYRSRNQFGSRKLPPCSSKSCTTIFYHEWSFQDSSYVSVFFKGKYCPSFLCNWFFQISKSLPKFWSSFAPCCSVLQ